MIQQADLFAERIRREAGPKPDAQVAQAFRPALGRAPRAAEPAAGLELAGKHGIALLGRARLNTNEFLQY